MSEKIDLLTNQSENQRISSTGLGSKNIAEVAKILELRFSQLQTKLFPDREIYVSSLALGRSFLKSEICFFPS